MWISKYRFSGFYLKHGRNILNNFLCNTLNKILIPLEVTTRNIVANYYFHGRRLGKFSFQAVCFQNL